jgi:hypothetical protein
MLFSVTSEISLFLLIECLEVVFCVSLGCTSPLLLRMRNRCNSALSASSPRPRSVTPINAVTSSVTNLFRYVRSGPEKSDEVRGKSQYEC